MNKAVKDNMSQTVMYYAIRPIGQSSEGWFLRDIQPSYVSLLLRNYIELLEV